MNSAFSNCSSLTSIVIPNSVTSIGSYAFYKCSSLTSIVIPNSVETIGDYAFYNCSSLTIYCEASSKPSGWNSFWNYSNRPVYWGITQEDIIIQSGIQYLIIEGNAVVTGHTNELTNDVVIPSSITVNGMSYNVTRIGNYAFYNYNCSALTSIVIPNSVTYIGSNAFYECSSLEKVYYEGTLEDWCKIGFSIISNPMRYASHFYIKSSNNEYEEVTEIVIPNTITSIGNFQFSGCGSLTSIVIPNSVTSIGLDAFSWCSSLTIYCEASSKPSGWNPYWNSDRPVYWAGQWSYKEGIPTPN